MSGDRWTHGMKPMSPDRRTSQTGQAADERSKPAGTGRL